MTKITAQNVNITSISFSTNEKLTERYTDNAYSRPVTHTGYTKDIYLQMHVEFTYQNGIYTEAGTADKSYVLYSVKYKDNDDYNYDTITENTIESLGGLDQFKTDAKTIARTMADYLVTEKYINDMAYASMNEANALDLPNRYTESGFESLKDGKIHKDSSIPVE